MYLLLGALLLLAGVILVLFSVWMIIRVGRDARSRRLSEDAYAASRLDADGMLLPPTDRGMCEGCGTFHRNIYYLPDGRRLCTACRAKTSE